MTPAGQLPREISRLRTPALVVAVVGIILMFIGLPISHEQFFRGYLVAWLFVLGISLGSMAMMMMGHLVEGEWAWLIRRVAEAAASNLFIVALLFIPLLMGITDLFPWAKQALVAADPILQHKKQYMNVPWFTIRAAIYFFIWIGLTAFVRRQSIEFDRSSSITAIENARKASAAGLLLFVITMTLASVDWVMSRDAHWVSTIIGFAMVVGQALSGMAFIVWITSRIAGREPLSQVIERKHLNDFGNLLLTLVILWAYMSFAQFLVIWMGNSKEDNSYYVDRGVGMSANGWRWLGLFLITFHFFVPFLILLSRDNKRRAHFLGNLALWLLVMRLLDVIWLVVPTAVDPHLGARGFTVMVIPAVMAVGGIWVASFVRNIERQPLLSKRLEPLSSPEHGAHAAGGAA